MSSAGGMDSPERLVLRRKKLLLATHFNLSNEHINRFREASFIKKSDHDFIKGEPTNIGRVGRLVDSIPVEGFEFLCELLEEHNKWLADELRAEMKTELGQLEIEEYIIKEASVIVHREFGASKRLAEGDKAKLSTLLAARTQFAKEVWKKQLSRTIEALQESKEENSEKDTRAQILVKKIEAFLKGNRHRMRRTRPPGRNNHDEDKSQQQHDNTSTKPPSSAENQLEVQVSGGQSPRPGSKASMASDQQSRKGTLVPPKAPGSGEAGAGSNAQSKSKTIASIKDAGKPHPPSSGSTVDQETLNLEQKTGEVTSNDNDPAPEAESNKTQSKTISFEAMKTFDDLHGLIEELISLADGCTTEKEMLRVERLRLMEALRVQPGDSELIQMDVRLKELLQQAQEAVDATTCKIKERDAQNKELQHKVYELMIQSDIDLEGKDKAISEMSANLKEYQDKNRDLQYTCMKLEGEAKVAKNELRQNRQKTASLERSRHLGYKSGPECRQGSGSRFPAIQS